jgi:hypothetical protein
MYVSGTGHQRLDLLERLQKQVQFLKVVHASVSLKLRVGSCSMHVRKRLRSLL